MCHEISTDESGDTFEDKVWVPTMVSPAVAVALFTLSSELGRVTQSRDTMENIAGEEGSVDMLEVLRSPLVIQAQKEIKKVYEDIKPSGLCEAGVLQLVLDVSFLRHWLEQGHSNSTASAGLESTYDSLVHHIDPINWQTYESLVEEAIKTQSAGCHFILSYLLRRNQSMLRSMSGGPPPAGLSPKKKTSSYVSPDDSAKMGSSNVMALVPAVPRFPLLPLPIDATTPTTPLSTRFPSPTRESAKAPNQYSYPFGDGPARAVAGAASAVLPSFSFSFISNQAASKASSLLRAGKR